MTAQDGSHEVYESLLMKRLDGFITPAENEQLEAHLQGCSDCAEELAEFAAVKTTTDTLRERILEDVRHDPLRPDLPTQAVNTVGMITLVVVLCGLLGIGFFAVWQDPSLSPMTRGAILTGMGVTTAVFLNVLRLRLAAAPHDPYREIDR